MKKFKTEVQPLLDSGNINYTTAEFLNIQNESDLACLIKLFSILKFSKNKQREVVEWFIDISKRDNIEIAEVYNKAIIENVLKDDLKNGPQKIDHIHNQLFKLRFPVVAEYLEGLKSRLNNLKLPENVKLQPISILEEKEFQINIKLSSLINLEKIADDIKRFTQSPEYIILLEYMNQKITKD